MERTPFAYTILTVDVGIVRDKYLANRLGKEIGDEYVYKYVDTYRKRFYLTLQSAQEALSHLILSNINPKRTFEIVPLYL